MRCTSITEQKAALRPRVKARTAEIPENLRRAQEKALFKAFLGLDSVKNARTVMVFWGVGEEPDTVGLISALLAYGKKVALPRCLPGRKMEARLYRGGRLVRSQYGIPEPGEDCPLAHKAEIDVVLVPALCYDPKGFRLGRGAGYYDRWLADYAGTTVGMCYKEVLQQEVPREEHDLPVKILLCIQ